MIEIDALGHELAPRTSFRAGDVNGVMMRFNPIPNSCAMVRRDAVLAIGGFDPRYRYAMDYDLWLRLADRCVITTLDSELAVRRMSGTNVAAQKERAQIAETFTMRFRALRRRRSLKDAHWLALPVVSLLTPQRLKRKRRRRLGQAP